MERCERRLPADPDLSPADFAARSGFVTNIVAAQICVLIALARLESFIHQRTAASSQDRINAQPREYIRLRANRSRLC
jgi:hypothetical protein